MEKFNNKYHIATVIPVFVETRHALSLPHVPTGFIAIINGLKMEKFNNKYRIPSARLQNWDYSTNAMYFITVCTQNRAHYFGEIENNTMQLSHTGILTNVFWHEIPNHTPNVSLGAFVVMPNHVHGILVLERVVETRGDIPEQPATGQQRFQNQGKNTVSSIVGSYKSAVTKHANRLGLQNGWQARFHDHIRPFAK